jgi:hypothetical protein
VVGPLWASGEWRWDVVDAGAVPANSNHDSAVAAVGLDDQQVDFRGVVARPSFWVGIPTQTSVSGDRQLSR